MFPPFPSRNSIVTDDINPLTRAYRDVVVYGDPDSDDVLYEGPIVVHANGWIELEGQRLLSPQAVHHIDIYDDDHGQWENGDETAGGGSGDDGRFEEGRDDYRTNRFDPR